jgi:hypothetical protein
MVRTSNSTTGSNEHGHRAGMRGKNTETLTYRGPDLKERAETRNLAGCTRGFCANQIRLGLVNSTQNSCDEVRATRFIHSVKVS